MHYARVCIRIKFLAAREGIHRFAPSKRYNNNETRTHAYNNKNRKRDALPINLL